MRFINGKFLFLLLVLSILSEPNTLFAQLPLIDSTHYSNGQIIRKGKFRYKKPHGIWLYYFPNGNMMRKEKWNNGMLMWQVKYDLYKRKIYGVNSKLDTNYYKGCNCSN
ncbi:MAG: hypothetical protein ACOVK9_01185 [Bacteroidia bacterium]|jgi:antitoxin component YwqK of YwqJK toxin-antitoxin module